MNSIVAIVGRPNVGKSTLFNRLVQRREAIVDSVSGVTRDRHYGKSDWNGKEFSVIDTGGYVIGSDDIFEEEIRKQVALAIDEADIIVFVVDVEDGITPMDAEVAKILRKVKKPIFTTFPTLSILALLIYHLILTNSMQSMYTYSNTNITNSRSTFRSDENGIK